MTTRRHLFLLILGLAFFFVGMVVVYVLTGGSDTVDRTTRKFGPLTCVYNEITDEVEACVETTTGD